MLRIVTGRFHPDLEQALVEDVRTFKGADPLAPLAVIVPSDALRRRLKRLFCVEHGQSLLEVHFLTFYQLAVRLLDETHSFDVSGIRSEFFFEELVHQLLRLGAGDSAWSDLVEMPGAWRALVATLSDLKDAGVEDDRALEAFPASQPDLKQSIRDLLALYRAFRSEKDRLHACDQDDLAARAAEHAPDSAFLSRQRKILYYGFYDLTQVQLDLFQAISRAYPATLYFPLVKGHPAFSFAQRFFERYIHGMAAHESNVLTLSSNLTESSPPVACLFDATSTQRLTGEGTGCSASSIRIVSVAGRWDEVTVAAKEILGLVEERGYAFHDIGIVARTLPGYETVIPRVFQEHGIPFTSNLGRSLGEFPLIKAVIQLLDLRASDYHRDQVIGVLSSPFIRLAALCPSLGTPRVDLWDMAARRLGITKGLGEWERLTRFLEKDLPLRDDDEGELVGPRIPAPQIHGLWLTVSCLAERLSRLPPVATWSEYADQVEGLSAEFFDARAGAPSAGDSGQVDAPADRLMEALDELRALSGMGTETSLADFVAAFHRLMEDTKIAVGASQGSGVHVLDAMAARGIPFRALFVLGLNEKIFPRHIHEDAFLRDRVRRVFEMDLGFKIQEKLAGYDEEMLLFYLVCNSAREELTLLYQRADDAGRALAPSSYLEEVRRVIGPTEVAVPRRLTKKFEEAPQYRIERLTPSEVSIKLLLERRIPQRLLQHVHPAGTLIARGLTTLRAHESGKGLDVHDGMTGPLETYWDTLTTRGVSPSGLQVYATCPFRYFADRVLRLEPLTRPETVVPVGSSELGTLAHEILRECLETLHTQGYFTRPPQPSADPFAVLEKTACVVFDRFAQSHSVGYPLVWELEQERMMALLRSVLRDDLDELADEWEPILFEEKMAGRLAMALPDGSLQVSVSGRLDRVDWSRSRRAYRIIDYKFKMGRAPNTLDSNLKLGAVRGHRLQPPLYLTMAEAGMPAWPTSREASGPLACAGVWFYYLAPNWEQPLTRVSFPGDAWTSELKDSLTRAIHHVLSGIHAGRFFIFPSGSCDHCDFSLLCRKTHLSTAWRARHDHAVVRAYRELRKASPPEARQDKANVHPPPQGH